LTDRSLRIVFQWTSDALLLVISDHAGNCRPQVGCSPREVVDRLDDGSRLTLFSMMGFDLREYRDVVAVRAQNWQADAGQHLRAIVGQAVAIGDPELSAGAHELERVALTNEEFIFTGSGMPRVDGVRAGMVDRIAKLRADIQTKLPNP